MTKPLQQRGADRRRFHYIYKTTCLITGRYYIGMHSTDDMNDAYMGSGKRLGYSLRKYGVDNHVRTVLEHCSTREELILREEAIVSSELLNDPMCMNLVRGGKGDWGWRKTLSEADLYERRIQKLQQAWLKPGFKESFSAKTTGRKRSEEAKAKMRAKWTPERLAAQAERLRLIAEQRPKAEPKPYILRRDRPGYIAPLDKSTLSKLGWVKLREDEVKLAAVKAKMSRAKLGRVTVNDGSCAKVLPEAEAQALLATGWSLGRPVKPGRVRAPNGRTREA